MKHFIKENQGYRLLIVLLLFSIFQYSIQRIYVFFLYPDEFGYWSSAATALGWDWKDVSGLGSFYSFGYSFILLPILKLIPDSLTAYRVAIAINMILMCIAFFLLQKISEKISPGEDQRKYIFFSGIAVLFPSWIFYMNFTATEATLMFLFVLLAWLFLLFVEKPNVCTGLLLAVVLGYSYVVHMRSIGILIACGITIVLWGICSSANRKKVLMLIAALIVVLIVALLLKEIVRENVYSGSGEEVLKHNEFSGQLGKIRFLLSADGMLQLLINLSGKILYMGVAGMGLFYYGMFWCIRQFIKLIQCLKNGEMIEGKVFWGIFLFLAAAAEIMIGSVYSIQNTDLDWIVYGRYSEFVLPVMMVLGLCRIQKLQRLVRAEMVIWTIHTILSMICLVAFLGEGSAEIRGYMSVGLSPFIGIEAVNPGIFFLQVWLLGGVFVSLASLCVYIGKKKKAIVWTMGLLMAVEILLGLYAGHMYVYPVNDYMRYDLYMGEKIIRDIPLETEILYLNEERTQWIDVVQMQLRERPVRVIGREELEQKASENTALIVHKDGQYREDVKDMYKYCKEYNIFCLYYN